MSEQNRSEVAEAAERIDRCQHQWVRSGEQEVRCVAGCDAVLSGSLAAEPPAVGMDWDRNVLVKRAAPELEALRDRAELEAIAEGRMPAPENPSAERRAEIDAAIAVAEAARTEQEAGQEVER
jgi:hypothetical protein